MGIPSTDMLETVKIYSWGRQDKKFQAVDIIVADDVCWPKFPYYIEAKKNGLHFPEDILNCIFFNENVWILIRISLKFVPRGPINNIPSLG